jgi:hypothetical protein
MSDQTKEAAPDPDSSTTAITNDAAAQRDEAKSPTTTELAHGNVMTEEKQSNGAKPAESGQEPSETLLKIQREEATSYRGDSKGNYPKRQSKSKYDPNAEPVPDDAATRAQKIRNLVCISNGAIDR